MENKQDQYITSNIRMATVEDAKVLLEIYAPYVRSTSITFEYDVPTEEEFANRIQNTLHKYPWIVYEKDKKVIGYAYAGPYAVREAYKWSTTLAIYLDEEYHHQGVARPLYETLMELLIKQGFYTAYAIITSPNVPSQKFHEKLGFVSVGLFPKAGFKHGQWRDVVYMQKILGEYGKDPQTPRTIWEIL